MKKTQAQVFVKGANPLKDVFKYRNVFLMLVKQQVFLVYNRAIFGIFWAILNPLLYLTVLVFVFTYVARVQPTSSIPFILVVFSGLIGWNLFSHFILQGANLLRSYKVLMGKIYFPRIYTPYAAIFNMLIEFCIGFVVLTVLMLWLKFPFHLSYFFIPFIFILAIFSYSGVMLITALLSFQYKDFQFLVPFLMQIGFYLSPIWFNPNLLGNSMLYNIYNCNPVVCVVLLIRACIMGSIDPSMLSAIIYSFSSSCIFFIIGILYWKRKNTHLMDIL